MGQQLPALLYGPGDHRGEKADEKAVAYDIPLRLQFIIVQVEEIGTALEHIEAQSHRQQYLRQAEVQAREALYAAQGKAGVFEHQQHQQLPQGGGYIYAPVPSPQAAAQIAEGRAEHKQQRVFKVIARIEHETGQQQHGVLPLRASHQSIGEKAEGQEQRPEL